MFILGKKLKMDQIWKDKKVIPVTVIKAAPNTVSLMRTAAKDGYEAVQLALGKYKREFSTKGGFASGGKVPAEFPFKKGDVVTVGAFSEGDMVRVSGTTKGRGFQGVVKRHGFSGGPKTHGQKNRHRMPGSIGNTTPQRVIPGRRMAGHMGVDRVTVKNLVVAGVDKEKNILLLRGAVPGARGGFLEIEKIKAQKVE
ncbi:MAG: 50S ribosomal protein L3 [Candidatus Liptonbacteria bacterium]|nr:50S ribosomal protein L3 [Candidatus Liptonbacteria bacterium]